MARGTFLIETHPEIAAQWHPERNEMALETVGTFSNKKVWWRHEAMGPDGEVETHEWEQITRNRTYAGAGCPTCRRRKSTAPAKPGATKAPAPKPETAQAPPAARPIRGRVALSVAAPEIAAQWHPTKNGDLTPAQVSSGSNRKVWWTHTAPDGQVHEWQAYINIRTGQGTGCPICNTSGGSRKQSWDFRRGAGGAGVDLASRFPAIAAQWHPTKNGDLTPDRVSHGAETLAWWRCEAGHEWQQPVNRRTHRQSPCWACKHPITLPAGEKAPGPDGSLAEKRPKVAALWHPSRNGHLTPNVVRPNSGACVWWQCGHGHVWRAAVSAQVATAKAGTTCPHCAKR